MSEEKEMVEVIVLTELLKIDGELESLETLKVVQQPVNLVVVCNVKVYDRKDNRPLYVAQELYLNPNAVVMVFLKDKIEKEGEY